jgi:hypothetical protein
MRQLTDHSPQGSISVTPSDTVNLTFPSGINRTRGIYVGGAGNISVIMADGTTALLTALSVGVVHDLSIKRVNATGTTATAILALY